MFRLSAAAVGVVVLACFGVVSFGQTIVINEVHYHPANGAVGAGEDPEDLQFVELHNGGTASVDLSGWLLTGDVNHAFAAGVTLSAGEFLVVAKDDVFLAGTVSPAIPVGVQVIKWDSGDLPNSGGVVAVEDDLSTEVDRVVYDDAAPWPTGADGFGPSLELIHSDFDNSYGSVWRASAATNGTPGVENSAYSSSPVVLSESPARLSIIANLTEVSVVFAEPVQSVTASDLAVDSSLATSVVCDTCVGGVGAGPYVFSGFTAPTTSPVNVALAPGSIEDESGHSFAGDTWIYSFEIQNVVINELHYNPDGGDDLEEFIELHNAEPDPVDISGWSVTHFSNTGFTFPASTVLAARDYVVIARYPAHLLAATGYTTAYQWDPDDKLSNSGETVALETHLGIVVDSVTYSDSNSDPAWPALPDGDGPSLELLNPSLDNELPGAWSASVGTHGTPGAENSVATDAPRILSELPARGTSVESLTDVTVVFTTPVENVVAGDLLVAGSAATTVVPASGPADTYTFSGFAVPPVGSVVVVLNAGAIVSEEGGIPFGGAYWTVSAGLVVLINEIHYHPAAPDDDVEFIEFYNAGANTAVMDNWTMCDGVEMTFPTGTTLPPGDYLVIAFDTTLLESLTGYADGLGWSDGRLSNGGEGLALCDDVGNVLDALTYGDSAPWASSTDGDGPSLELISPLLPNEYGGAWQASVGTHGTPGAENSTYQPAPPPIILDPIHDPPIPASDQDVLITVTVIDDAPDPTVTLNHRQDQEPPVAYTLTTMYDDGFHGDGLADDHLYGAIVAGLADGERLDFFISADDGAGTSIAPVGHSVPDGSGYPSQTFLVKFSDDAPDLEFPTYHLITTQHTRDLQETIDRTSYDATFVQCDTSGTCEVFYNVTERYRGHSTLTDTPHGFRIDFSDDHPLQSEMGFEITDLVLMSQEIDRQHLGYEFFREVFGGALPASMTQFVRLNTNPLAHGGAQNWIYINLERVDDRFLDSQDGGVGAMRYPKLCSDNGASCDNDSDCVGSCVNRANGNLYRARHTGNLDYRGENPDDYRATEQPEGGTDYGYDKETNEAEDDWTDLIDLCFAIDAATTDGEDLEAALESLIDVDQWLRWFGAHMLLANGEGGLYRDSGDDYFVYFEPIESPNGHNATLIPWDLDGVWGGHWYRDNYWEQPTIWRTGCGHPCNPFMSCPSPLADTSGRFVRSNAFAGRMVNAIWELLDNEFTQANVDAMVDAIPDSVLAQSIYYATAEDRKAQLKSWAADRRTTVLNEIVSQMTLDGLPSSPYSAADPVIALSGDLDQRGTYQVVLNDEPVDYYSVFKNPYPDEPCGWGSAGADWSKQLVLGPGVNEIMVQCLDHEGAEVDRVEDTVTYSPSPWNLRLTAPSRMVADKTLTLKAELLDLAGEIHWREWNTVGTVSAQLVSDGTPIPTTITVFESHADGVGGGVPAEDSIRLYNGVGSVSITLDDPASVAGQAIEIFVNVDGLVASKVVTVLENVPGNFRQLSGTLTGADLVWGPGDGVIHLTGDVTIPTGETLSLAAGTLVMVDAGSEAAGTRILLSGSAVDAQGTVANPIFFFPTEGAAAMALPQGLNEKNNFFSWRGFAFEGAGSSTFSYVFLTGAGNGAIEFHPRPPVLYLAEGGTHSLTLTDCVFADAPGEIVFAKGSGTYTISRCLFSRVGIGGEFVGGDDYTVLVEDSWFTRIGRAPEENNVDGDMLHLDQVTTVPQTVRRCIFTDGGDDVIDHSNGAHPVIEDCIIYDARDKAVSLYYSGDITMTNCLVFDVPNGIEATGRPVYLTNCTFGRNTQISNRQCSLSDIDKCIFWPISIVTCCNYVDYTLIGSAGHLGCGTCNLVKEAEEPLFVDSAGNDFNLHPDSPAVDVCGQGRIGWLGFPSATACATDGDCDDSDACTIDACHVGVCVHGGRDCSAYDDACNVGVCNGGTGECEPQPVADDTPCSDGEFCNGSETCQAGLCVPSAGPCNDGVDCTDDSCDEVADTCSYVPNDGLCDNGLFCDGAETCDEISGCVDGAEPCVDQAHCDEAADACLSCVEDADCDNGLFCDGVETCVDNECVAGVDPCDDSVACTDDSCEETTDICSHVPNDGLCGNGLFCDGAEACDEINGCGDGVDPCVDLAHCDEDSDVCYECVIDDECDDGAYCNGAETCVDNECVSDVDPCGDPCEQCDEARDTCEWCIFELDGDGFIGPGDFSFFAGCYGDSYSCDPPTYRTGADGCCITNFDESSDSFVGPGDFSGLAGCYGDYCDACSLCWGAQGRYGGIAAQESTPAASLALVATSTLHSSEVAAELPRSENSFRIGSSFYIELWARAGQGERGLAAVHANVRLDVSRLAVEQVLPSGKFGLFSQSAFDPSDGQVGLLGGCASLSESSLDTETWVRVGSIKVRATEVGSTSIKTVSAGKKYGVAMVEGLGLLDAAKISFGEVSLSVYRRTPVVDQTEEAEVKGRRGAPGRP